MRNHNLSMKSIKISSKKNKEYDVVIIVTDHDRLNYENIRKNSNLLIDTRGIFRKNYSNVISA